MSDSVQCGKASLSAQDVVECEAKDKGHPLTAKLAVVTIINHLAGRDWTTMRGRRPQLAMKQFGKDG